MGILYLRCPECEFETKEENNFEDHAIKNHPMSFELFRKKSVEEEEFDVVVIRKEQMSDFDEKEINSEQFDFHDTEKVDENDLPDIIQLKNEKKIVKNLKVKSYTIFQKEVGKQMSLVLVIYLCKKIEHPLRTFPRSMTGKTRDTMPHPLICNDFKKTFLIL